MRVVETIAAVRAVRPDLGTIGLVPTMGFLHAGHMSLVARAKADCSSTAVSIFVNPAQFGPSEDLGRYPRDLARDLAMLEGAGVDLVFCPSVDEIYPAGFATAIDTGPIAALLEGARRPRHFAGVATVVTKLFNIVAPTRAYFGQKDAQQTIVIRRLVRDLDLPVDLVVVPTVREPDGLALSSRNLFLSPAERAAAPVLYRALDRVRALFEAGEHDADALRAAMRTALAAESAVETDYVSIADPETLAQLKQVEHVALAAVAARIGSTRLIDNILLGVGSASQ